MNTTMGWEKPPGHMLHLNCFLQLNVLIVFLQGKWKNIINQVREKDFYERCVYDLFDRRGIAGMRFRIRVNSMLEPRVN